MRIDWDCLTDDMQIALAGEAMRRVSNTVADQAECLAREMENGALLDRGGPDALRLLAAVIRTTGRPRDATARDHAFAGNA